jgi:hypothetical protein
MLFARARSFRALCGLVRRDLTFLSISFLIPDSYISRLCLSADPVCSAAYVLLGVLAPMAIGKEEEKNSKYISRIEGRFGKLEHGHHH